MSQLTKHDLNWAVQRLPPKVKKLLQDRPNRIFVAGGYLRSRITGEKVSDIDLFTATKDEARTAIEDLIIDISIPEDDRDVNATREDLLHDLQPLIYETENAFTAKGTRPMIQAIHRWTFDNPIAAIESFDFTIAKAAIWWTGSWWESVCHHDYYADIAGKRLVYTSPVREESAGGSLLRVLKFYQRGYRIPLESLAAVIARLVNSVEFQKVDFQRRDSEAHLTYILKGLLREVDPNTDPDAIQPLAGDPEQKETETHE
jgi:hypothetical protein